MDNNVEAFKKVAGDYFNQLGISALRSYGRHLELRDPTTKKKADLIAEILGVLCGEMSTKRNNRGAPIKNNYVEPAVLETVERLKSQFLYKKEKKEQTFNEILEEFLKNSQKWNILTFHDNVPQKTEKPRKVAAQTSSGELILRGQLETFENVACLLPENGDMQGDKIYLPAEFVQKFDLRDGDVVVCYAKRNDNTVSATEVLTVNDEPVKSSGERRIKFEECDVCEAEEKLDFGAEEENPVLVKYLNC